MRHVFDGVKVLGSLRPAVVSTDTVGTDIIDTQGYNDGMLIAHPGALTAAATDSYSVIVYENDTSTTSGAVVVAGVSVTFNSASTAGLPLVARIRGLGENRKRYLYAKVTASATTVSFGGSAAFALGLADSNPVNVDLTN